MTTTLTVAEAKERFYGPHEEYAAHRIWEEFKELWVELVNLSHEGIQEEYQDVAYAIQMVFHQMTGYNFRMIFCKDTLVKFTARLIVWKLLFDVENVPFNRAYLKGGGNWKRPKKIQAAFRMAGKELSIERAEELIVFAGG